MKPVQPASVQIEPDLRENVEIKDLSQQVDTLTTGHGRLFILNEECFSEVVVETLSVVFVNDVARTDVRRFAIRQEMKVGRSIVGFQVKINVVGGRGEEEREIAREVIDHSLVRTTDFHDVTVKIENTGLH